MDEQTAPKARYLTMNIRFVLRSTLVSYLAIIAWPTISWAQDSGAQLAAGLRAKEHGSTSIRMRMQTGSGVLQLEIKSRVSDPNSDIVYQVLFPKERKGEAVLLHRSGDTLSGTKFTPPASLKPIGQMSQPLFGSSLTYEDV